MFPMNIVVVRLSISYTVLSSGSSRLRGSKGSEKSSLCNRVLYIAKHIEDRRRQRYIIIFLVTSMQGAMSYIPSVDNSRWVGA